MRILRLDLLAFGPFTNESLSLHDGDYGLHIVFGANEAGKSSALRALTHLLYGVPHNSRDNFVHSNQNMRIGALLQGKNGDTLECVRRKGRTGTLRAADDVEVIDASRLVELLGGVDESMFCERFGIDYDELRKGGEALVAGHGDLGEILFAAGAGIADLRPLQTRLSEEAEQLFKPRGSVQQINVAISELAAARKEIKQAQLPSSEWVTHDKAFRDAEARKRQIDQQLIQKAAERSRLERIAEALPLIVQRCRVLDAVTEMGGAPILPVDFAERRMDTITQLAANKKIDDEALATTKDIKASIAALHLPEQLIQNHAAITKLFTDLGSFQKAANDRPNLILKQQHAENQARDVLRDIGQGEDLEESVSRRLSKPQRVTIQSLGSEQTALVMKCNDAKQRVKQLRDEIDQAERTLSELANPVDGSELQRAVRNARQCGNVDDQFVEAEAELRRLKEQATIDLQKLPLWSGTLENLEKLPVPAAETVDRYESDLADAAGEIKSLNLQIEQNRESAQTIDKRLAELQLEHDVPIEEDLACARKQREEGWRLIRHTFISGIDSPDEVRIFTDRFAPGGDLTQAFAASVRIADEIADRLRSEAGRVAMKAQLTADRQSLEIRVTDNNKKIEAAKSLFARTGQEWVDRWQPLRIIPLSPREMRSWSNAQSALVRLAELTRTQVETVEQLRTIVQSHREMLIECLTQLGHEVASTDQSLSAILQRCDDLIGRIDSCNTDRKTQQQELQKLRVQLSNAQQQSELANEAVEQWISNWTEAITHLGLNKDATPAEANAVLAAIDDLFAKLKEATEVHERIEGIDRDANEFNQRIRQVCDLVAADLIGLPIEQSVAKLNDRLNAALKAQTQFDTLNEQLQREESKREKAAPDIHKLQATLDTMCREAGCSSPDALPDAERCSARRRDLDREMKNLEEQLVALAAGASLESFIYDSTQVDGDQLRPMIGRLSEEIAQLDDEKSRVSELIGSERVELQRMDGSSQAAEAQERAEHYAAQIRSNVEQYVRLRLASAALRGAIDRYREKNQEPVLQRASDLFAELTCSSFESLRPDYNEKGEAALVAVRPGGKQTIGVECLSDGTESQLYLALRLAILEMYLADHEPIPFIVDDILKDFDDDRSVAALKALSQLAEKTQVIVFTHHRHLVQLAEDNLDDDIVFRHVLDRTGSVTGLPAISDLKI